MLSHYIKNRAVNIDMLAGKARTAISAAGDAEAELELIQSESQQLLQMVRRVQSHVEDFHLIESAVSLRRILDEALRSQESLLRKKQVEIKEDYGTDVQLICDPVHLREVFVNLIRNAVEAMNGEARPKILRIGMYRFRGGVRIEFADTGKGLSKDDLEKVFSPFYTTKQTEGNFGLGLTYCFLTVQKHDGTIEAFNSEEGDVFSIKFPKKRIS
ncbi:hypothetical protein SD70_01960 [Gordoniibacillus kamchatkensis]|uniref:histidine kinase n=1 Tax=Gordoniibacillus kamchatkensis TaxID=1590651 RepID=A0ABR5AMS5_9BACL|nr:HAMP domain-containing sensor histidine kinase [Paenibacillus sp. VKM B-2647]KIL42304.1 hypothetical protein SD70_01960 [Paenibacillus sp. VKM B-2647]